MKTKLLCILMMLLLLLSGCNVSPKDRFSNAYEDYFDGEVQIVLGRVNAALSLSECIELANQYVAVKKSEEKINESSTIYKITFSTTNKNDLGHLIRSFETCSGWKETIYEYWAIRKKLDENPPNTYFEEDDEMIFTWYPQRNDYFVRALSDFEQLPINAVNIYGRISRDGYEGYPRAMFYLDVKNRADFKKIKTKIKDLYGFDDTDSGILDEEDGE